ncbi:hypothetical protein DL762_005871 [Monosporascus cannonballus]|uniref:Major facilitator superfamily (MFS) profile domain-containing protein n=1 Tax=Monosporascus cannonballus TaxID=155416 RepID=A0ABY0H4K7_9PEZI|nr:hypothetical protein DL762_005871 [Monosporascus cannonballus]
MSHSPHPHQPAEAAGAGPTLDADPQREEEAGRKRELLGAAGTAGLKPDEKRRPDGKVLLTEDEAESALAFALPEWRKWSILVLILCIQTSMNSNASMYGFAVDGLAGKYAVPASRARLGQFLFLFAYGFGCEFWAPWSEELGRWPTQQASLFLVNLWQILSALSPGIGGVLVSRVLSGLSTAGGSVTLGVIADMYHPEDTGFQYAVAFVILSSVGGAPIGAVIGGFVGQYRPGEWIFWTLMIMGGIVQALHFFLLPETNTFILMDREARRRRENGVEVYGPNEVKKPRFSGREILKVWWRPFLMFLTEPIVVWLSLLSGFADMLVFIFLEAFTPNFRQYGFETYQIGLAFLASIVAYTISYLTYLPVIWHHNKTRKIDPDRLSPESRLGGSSSLHWIAPIIFAAVIGIANYGVYKSSIDYMIAAYGPYAASATGGNDLARDVLAGLAALYAHPLYENIGDETHHLIYPSTILACLGVIVIIPIYIFYMKGEKIRLKSKFAQELEIARQERLAKRRRASVLGSTAEKEKQEATYVENV